MRRQMKKHSPLIYDLRDEARRHNLKLLGNGTLTKQTIEAHKHLICEAAYRLSHLPAGDMEIVESERDDIFVVVRSLETKPPRRCECCQPRNVTPATVTDERHLRDLNKPRTWFSSLPATNKPSPPGRT